MLIWKGKSIVAYTVRPILLKIKTSCPRSDVFFWLINDFFSFRGLGPPFSDYIYEFSMIPFSIDHV